MTDRCNHRDVVGPCERIALPTLVVCAYHATPDAIRIAMHALAAERDRLRAELAEVQEEFRQAAIGEANAVRERDRLRAEIADIRADLVTTIADGVGWRNRAEVAEAEIEAWKFGITLDSGDPPRADRDDAYARAAAELRQLLSAFVDAHVLHGHAITKEQWERACLLCGRWCPPFTDHRDPETIGGEG